LLKVIKVIQGRSKWVVDELIHELI
jgi:hypothetical protein